MLLDQACTDQATPDAPASGEDVELALAVLTTPGPPQAAILRHLTFPDRLNLRATCTSTRQEHAGLVCFPALSVEARASHGGEATVVTWERRRSQARTQKEVKEGSCWEEALDESIAALPAALVVAFAAANTAALPLPATLSTLTALTKLEATRGSEPGSCRHTLNLSLLAPLAALQQLIVSGATLSGGGQAALAPAAAGGDAEGEDESGAAAQALPVLLPRLQVLKLVDCNLRRLPPQLAGSPGGSLTSLSLSQNRDLEEVAAPPTLRFLCCRLVRLELDGCCLAALPAQLSALTALTHLDLSYNTKLDGGWQHLAPLTQLRVLNLRSCELTAVPAQLAALPGLTRLNLSWNARLGSRGGGGGATWHHLLPLTRLRQLHLCGVALPGGKVPQELATVPRLHVHR